jgi:hypothetical protein
LDQSIALAKQANWLLPLGPYWLLACNPEPFGCINVNPGMPVGRLEWLTVMKHIDKRTLACTVRDLCYAGMAILKQQGSQFVAGYVADHQNSWKRVIEKRGLNPVEDGTLYMGKL